MFFCSAINFVNPVSADEISVLKATSYRFSKAVYWVVPLIIALSALAYFAFAQPEQLFGTASFKNGLEVVLSPLFNV